MALRSFGIASAAGFTCALLRKKQQQYTNNTHDTVALCDDRKMTSSSTSVADAPTPLDKDETCKCVIVGGGFAGAKLAHYLDSMLNVTLIDEKNYYEMSYGIIPLITRQWNEVEGDVMNSVTELKKFSSLHRFFLKRANVVTGTATTVTDNEVILSDGRRVPYDLLVLATGGQKSFPFASTQRTLAGRIDELKQFNLFLREKCQKIAIIGGGPAGVSLAASLLEQQPEKEVVLFHSHNELCPNLPKGVRKAAMDSLLTMRENTSARKRTFSRFISDDQKLKDEIRRIDEGSFTLKLNHRVNRVETMPNATATIVAKTPTSAAADGSASSSSGGGGFLSSIFGGSSSKTQTFTNVPMKYRVIADDLDITNSESSAARQKLLESRSILHRLYFGDVVPQKSQYASVMKNSGALLGGNKKSADAEEAANASSSVTSEISSASPSSLETIESEIKSKIGAIKRENVAFDDFDFVFDMRGTVPRPIVTDSSVVAKTRNPITNQPDVNILNSHVLPDGKYRSSLLLQLLGRPNIFALGKCNNLPWVNSDSMSDVQVKTLFSAISSILFADPTNPKSLSAASDGIQIKKMAIPRLMIPLGSFEAAGYSTQKGVITGITAPLELKADREHLMREFVQPVFWKQRDQKESRNRVMCWLNEDITDVTDFCF